MPRKSTKEEFIEKAKSVHGDKYDYSLIEYDGYRSKKKLKIICKHCGKIFEQKPNSHIAGQGCPNLCYIERKRTPFIEFVEKARKVHYSQYDYDEDSYNTQHEHDYKIKIFCRTCNRYFYQDVQSHIAGRGCPHCMYKRAKATLIRRYGDASYNNKEKARQTCLEKYGFENLNQSPEIKRKIKDTKLLRYGDENYNNRSKYRQTCLEKYGTEFSTQAESTKDKAKRTYMKHFGTDHPFKSREIINKGWETRKRNGTCNTSSAEKEILKLLKARFSNVLPNYKSKLYPFHCDFYVQDLGLYIEYQRHWTHGFKPFENTKEDQERLNIWTERAKNSDFYKSAINVWTIRDPLKRETAKNNNLSWIEFFDFDTFMNWYNTI